MGEIKHPAKYTDVLIPTIADMVSGSRNVLDPFAGTGKIGLIRMYGYDGKIFANELEPEWISDNEYGCDVITTEDAETLSFADELFEAIATSPTYGNRMADHHNAKDGSHRITYTHCIGRKLRQGNTGCMQWGDEYREKHKRIYKNLVRMLKKNGVFVINCKNHIRKGKEIDVVGFHEKCLNDLGLHTEEKVFIETPSMGYGANSKLRVSGEYVIKLRKL